MPQPPRAAPNSFPDKSGTYASMEDFLGADPDRLGSPEVDFGLYWRDVDSSRSYRAAWIEHTQELYLVQAGAPQTGGGHVEVLGVAGRASLETALRGWRMRCHAPGSVRWLRRRAAEASRGRGVVTTVRPERTRGAAG